MRILLGALAVAALCKPVLAESWIDIDRTPQVTTAIEAETAQRSGTHVRFWMRQIFTAERRIGNFGGRLMTVANAQGAAHFVEIRSFVDLDCRARTFTSLYAKFYSRDGRMVSEAALRADIVAFRPDTVIAAGAELLCPKT